MRGDADLAATAAAFGARLRQAGVPVTPEQLRRFVQSNLTVMPVTNGELYWIARITLVRSSEQLEEFDRVFNEVFRGVVDVADSRGDDNAPDLVEKPPLDRRNTRDHPPPTDDARPDGRPHPTGAPAESNDAREREVVLAVMSTEERLATTDFAELTDDELRELYRLMQKLRTTVPPRRARRHRRHRHGGIVDLRATLRRSRQHGGDPIERVMRRHQQRPRKLVVLCDISGSMAPYSRACVQLLHAAAGSNRAEVFTFATRLTRVTKSLAITQPDVALARAAESAPDWKGGTRIGASLKTFVDDYGRRGLARGAVLVIVSDGWDRGDPDVVREQMERLSRLAHRIVWINPRSAAAGFEPLARGMAAALPYCDELASGHTLASLGEAMAMVSRLGRRTV